MKVSEFLENFGLFIESPNGVEQAKQLILTLAFQGHLVAPSGTDARELLKSLPYSTKGLVRSSGDKSSAFRENLIPTHWCWVAVRHLGRNFGQKKPTQEFSYIDVSLIDNARGVIGSTPSVLTPQSAPSRARKIVKKGSVIYSTVRPYLKNIAIVDRDYEPEPIASTAFAVVHPHKGVLARFLYYYLRSPAFVSYVESVQTGIAYPAINDAKFFEARVPLPPTEEQQRIVAKVDELMALCDKLDRRQSQRERLFVVMSTMRNVAFVNTPSLPELAYVLDEPRRLVVNDLVDSVASLALQGQLLPSKETSSSEVDLDALKRKQQELSRAEGLRKRPAVHRITRDAWPYIVPDHWALGCLDDLAVIVSGVTKGRNIAGRKTCTLPYLRVANVQRGALDLSTVKEIEIPLQEV